MPRKTVVELRKGFHVQALNPKQEDFLKNLRHPEVPLVLAIGSAGTGKTYCAASLAASQFLSGYYSQIVITRPNVSTGRSLGFFPGTVEEKLAIWLAPILNILRYHLGGKYQHALNKGDIVLKPLEVVRGSSFENAFIIVDESQNLTKDEIRALSTRVGEGSKLVFLGDPCQRDVKADGLDWFVTLCKNNDIPCGITLFNSDDIVRSELTKALVKAFEKE